MVEMAMIREEKTAWIRGIINVQIELSLFINNQQNIFFIIK